MQMINIGICDDGKNICSSIEKMIEEYAKNKNIFIEIEIWYTGEALCDYLREGNSIDILFLDIELFELNGIEVGNYIRNELENRIMQIVYISGKSSYALQLFKIQPMDFLVKPITQQQMEETLNLALKLLGKNVEKFEFQCGKDYYYIPYVEILYFYSEGRKIKIVTTKDEKEFYGKLADKIKKLPSNFIVIHKSFVVNREYISKFSYEMVELVNGNKLSISKAYRKKVREILLSEEWNI